MTKIQPIIAYACDAWFVHPGDSGHKMHFGISDKALRKLESLQLQCLRQVSGAMKGTSRIVMEKELHIESIKVFLFKRATTSRIRALHSPETALLTRMRNKLTIGPKHHHPYHILDNLARRYEDEARCRLERLHGKVDANKKWSSPEGRNKAIKDWSKDHAATWSAKLWISYIRKCYSRKDDPKKPPPSPALSEPWGPRSFKYYKNLARAQSTMLLHCRTGVIGLDAYLSLWATVSWLRSLTQ